jgi:hypothetical protein
MTTTIKRLDTVPGLARTMIGVASTLGRKAALDPTLSRTQGEEAIETLRIVLKAYEALIMVERPSVSMNGALNALDAPEKADYDGVKHQLVLLRAVYSPQASA